MRSSAQRSIRHLPSRSHRQAQSTLAASKNAGSTAGLLETLRRNKELTVEDAQNELRWIRQAVQDELRSAPPRQQSGDSSETVLKELVERRARGEPLQYVLGNTYFGPLKLECRSPVLIPRPETEHITTRLAQTILAQGEAMPLPLDLIDLCTGSGCIALLLAHHLGQSARVTGIDVSPDAIMLAKSNAKSTGIKAQFQLADLWRNGFLAQKRFDIVVSNPPYIPRREWDRLDDSVKKYEDPLALIGDPVDVPNTEQGVSSRGSPGAGLGYYSHAGKGLAFYRRIAELLPSILTSEQSVEAKGWIGVPRVAVEIGLGQAKDVQNLLVRYSRGEITRTEVWDDQYGRPRMVVGWSD